MTTCEVKIDDLEKAVTPEVTKLRQLLQRAVRLYNLGDHIISLLVIFLSTAMGLITSMQLAMPHLVEFVSFSIALLKSIQSYYRMGERTAQLRSRLDELERLAAKRTEREGYNELLKFMKQLNTDMETLPGALCRMR